MIDFDLAQSLVMQNLLDLGEESIPLMQSVGRILAEDIRADRDFPPFNRATKDGIAIAYKAIENGQDTFRVTDVISAGMAPLELTDAKSCLEIMTGAVVPQSVDTVIMYEHITIAGDKAIIQKGESPKKGQNIHLQGSDKKKGGILLFQGVRITGAEIGVMATVGKTEVRVKRNPKVCVISTGNELVDVHQEPLPYQIRRSNSLSLKAALKEEGIDADIFHIPDDKEYLKLELKRVLEEYEVLLLSGGVSKGKFDYLPEALEANGVEKIFHRVKQRPGKPFWFGHQPRKRTVVFSFPGNPVSTYANFHVYFVPWLHKTLGLEVVVDKIKLEVSIKNEGPLTRLVQVATHWDKGIRLGWPLEDGGSGDLASLVAADGFICLRPRPQPYKKGELVPFFASR